jgi:hypothetical protein
MKGEGNHQYGLKGELNASFKGGVNLKSNNKLTERYIYVGSWYKRKICTEELLFIDTM